MLRNLYSNLGFIGMPLNQALIEMKAKPVHYLQENLNAQLEEDLNRLLVTCFKDALGDAIKDRRFTYFHRWVIFDEQGLPVGHIGVHEKEVRFGGSIYPIGGIAGVCVDPDHRGRGYVGIMLEAIRDWMRERGFVFLILFGKTEVYGSSGYVRISNLVHGGDEEGWKPTNGMVLPLADIPWPEGEVRLPGPRF